MYQNTCVGFKLGYVPYVDAESDAFFSFFFPVEIMDGSDLQKISVNGANLE